VNEGLHIGPILEATTEELREPDGQFAPEVAHASRFVCNHPMDELFAIFDERVPRGNVIEEIGSRLGALIISPNTGRAGVGELPYSFVYDSLLMTIPAIAEMRGRMRVLRGSSVHPNAAGLAMCNEVRDWMTEHQRGGSGGDVLPSPLCVPTSRLKAQMPSDSYKWLLALAEEGAEAERQLRLEKHKPTPGRIILACARRSHRKGEVATIAFPRVDVLIALCAHFVSVPTHSAPVEHMDVEVFGEGVAAGV